MTALPLRVLALLALLGVAPCSAQMTLLRENETRVAAVRDDLRVMQHALLDQDEMLSKRISSAFGGNPDWAEAAEAYYSRRKNLLKRVSALDDKIAGVQAKTGPDNAEDIAKRLDKLNKPFEILVSDFELYTRLPVLAHTQDRAAAQASMRLLAQRQDYTEALALFLSRTPGRAPFPLRPGVMLIRPR